MSLRLSVDVEGILRPVVRGLLLGVHGRESTLAAPFVVDAFSLEQLFDVEPILHWDLDSTINCEKVDAGDVSKIVCCVKVCSHCSVVPAECSAKDFRTASRRPGSHTARSVSGIPAFPDLV